CSRFSKLADARAIISEKIPVQMSTLMSFLRSLAVGPETSKQKERNNNESTNLLQQNTTFVTLHRSRAREWARLCDRRVAEPSDLLEYRGAKSDHPAQRRPSGGELRAQGTV